MLVMQRQRRGIQLLRHPDAPLDPKPLPLRPCRDPGERNIRNPVVVLVEPADIAMSARENHFLHYALPIGSKRNVLKKAPRENPKTKTFVATPSDGNDLYTDSSQRRADRNVARQSAPAIFPTMYAPKCVPSPGSRRIICRSSATQAS